MVIKTIRSFLLLLASTAIVLHMIIPHDHHISEPVNGLKDTCPFSDEKSDHHPVFPAHCHVFNDLAAEKISRVIVKQEFQSGIVFVFRCSGSIVPDLPVSQIISHSTGKHFSDNTLSELSPLRAPPSII